MQQSRRPLCGGEVHVELVRPAKMRAVEHAMSCGIEHEVELRVHQVELDKNGHHDGPRAPGQPPGCSPTTSNDQFGQWRLVQFL